MGIFVSARIKYTEEEKYEILKTYENGVGSMQAVALKYKISKKTLLDWRYAYRKYGINGLKDSHTWKSYSKELKEQAVMDYLSGQYSLGEIVRKYEISGKSVLVKWINKYNSHREINATAKGMNQSMIKGRLTSWKERIEIVIYCIAHNKDYQNASEVYHVSYQQIYHWVKKYELGGEDELKDRRGRKKNEEELTTEDRVNLEIKKLKAENERLRAENEFLKKLEELERGRS